MHNSGNPDSAGGAVKTAPASGAPLGTRTLGWRQLATPAALAAVLALCFISPLWDWMAFAHHSEFYSYMPLMPLITGYLIWQRRAGLGAEVRPSWG